MGKKLYLANSQAPADNTRVVNPKILYKKPVPVVEDDPGLDYEGIMKDIYTDQDINNRRFVRPKYTLPQGNIYEGYQDPAEDTTARVNNLVKVLGTEGVEITPEDQLNMTEVSKRVPYYANRIASDFGIDDKKWFEDTLFGVLGVETNLGRLAAMKPEENSIKKRAGQLLLGMEPNDMSLGIGRTKAAAVPDYVKNYVQVNDYKDLADRDKSIAASAAILAHNYNNIKAYSKQFPELGMTDEDIRNLAILGYNQGLGKILNIGKLNDKKDYKEELKSFRDLYNGTTTDLSSTWYGHLPEILQRFINIGPKATYIHKIKNYRRSLLGDY